MRQLEAILKRNSSEPDGVDITDEVEHYFFFDKIRDASDLEEAWSVFPEHAEIRKRLALVESDCKVVPGWGYRIPGEVVSIDDAQLLELVRQGIRNLRPMLLDTDENSDAIAFIDGGFDIVIAPSGAVPPDPDRNDFFLALYEAIQEDMLARFPFDKPHYRVLWNWAIYLTKCDEVASYLLWPCLSGHARFSDDVMAPFVGLWKRDCRDRFWVKRGDFSSGMIYVKPPWMDAA